jgi:FKBP-type peptidyl-prolyl cis-trans isomerase
MRYMLILVLIGGLLISLSWAEENAPLRDQKARDSYSLGYEFGGSLKSKEIAVDIDVLLSAVRDGLSGKKPLLSQEEMRDTLNKLKRTMIVAQDRRYRKLTAKNLEAGKAFLEENKKKKGCKPCPAAFSTRC